MNTNNNVPAGSGKKPKGQAGYANALRTTGTILLSTILVGIIIGCVVLCVMTVYVLNFLEQDNGIDLRTIKFNYTTILYANDKNTGDYVELQRIHKNENRIWADLAEIPQSMRDATIAIEDERFNTHGGVDWKRTIASAVNYSGIQLYKGTPGGSTIHQQLIKNITLDTEVSVDRKLREIFRALQLDRNYSKDEIMEAYLNTISLGHNTNGVQAAANLYFNKDIKDITPAEACAIISITKNPSSYSPFLNPENNKVRREYALGKMLELGMLSQQEYDEAMEESANMVFAKETAPEMLNSDLNWFEDAVIEAVIKDLVDQKGYTKDYAENLILRGGYRIYTTVDTKMQDYLEEKYKNPKTFPPVRNKEYPQSAFVIMDTNGKVVALVGGKGEKEGDRLFSRAVDATRQPGSTIKPITSYALAIENDIITYSTLVNDAPLAFKQSDGTVWKPVNYYPGYKGLMTVDEALQRSTNTIAVQLTDLLTPNATYSFLKDKLHVSSMAKRDIAISPMSLGSLTNGISPLELAGAYQMIANGGTYTKPYFYTEVVDSDGNVILKNNPQPQRVISFETSTILNKLLQRVTTGPFGTGRMAKFGPMPVAGKTGTSDLDYNQWFVGMTPYYIGVCWLGYDQEATISYYNYPPPILWKNVMAGLHQNLPVKDFPASNKVVSKSYCLVSGLIAGPDCEETAIGWYKTSNIPDECNVCTGSDEIDEVLPSWSPSIERNEDESGSQEEIE